MKTQFTHIIGVVGYWFVLLLCLSVQAGSLSDVHVGLSPYHSPQEAKVIRLRVSQFVLEAPPGTHIVVHDAYALQEIARFEVPLLKFDSAEERARRMAEPFAKLASWYGLVTKAATSPRLKDSGALRMVSQHTRRTMELRAESRSWFNSPTI